MAAALAADEARRAAEEAERVEGVGEPYTVAPALSLKRPRSPDAEVVKQRREGMLSEPSSLLQQEVVYSAPSDTPPDAQMIGVLNANPLFESLPEVQKQQVYSTLTPRACQQGEMIVTEGEMGSTMFVVDSGEYQMHISTNGEEVLRTFTRGESFGELALMFNTSRAASIKCSMPGQLWVLDRVVFRRILLAANRSLIESKMQFLKAVPLFTTLTQQQQHNVAAALEEEE